MPSRWTEDDEAGYRELLAEAAGHEAVREAEAVVGEAWLATLSEAVEQTAADQRACTHMRDTAYRVVKAAEAGRKADEITASHKELAVSQRALTQVRRRNAVMRQFADQERRAWADAAKDRRLAAIADRERLSAAAPETDASAVGAQSPDAQRSDVRDSDAQPGSARQDRAG